MTFNSKVSQPHHASTNLSGPVFLRSSQASYSPRNRSTKYIDVLTLDKNLVWIPEKDTDITLRLFTIARGGDAGHRGAHPTWYALRELFTGNNQSNETRAFLLHFLLYVLINCGEKIPPA